MQDNNIKHKEHDKKQTLYEDLPYLNIGILISVIFHIFFIYILITKPQNSLEKLKFNSQVFPIEFVKLPKEVRKPIDYKNEVIPKIKNQIVDSSDIENNITPQNTNLLSEKNNTVNKEMIKRGDNLANKNTSHGNHNSKSNSINAKINNNISRDNLNNKDISNNKPLSLKLDNNTLFKNFGNINSNNKSNQNLLSKNQNYKPFSRPQGSGAKFDGGFGSSMYLPNLPDGDMTLLNTKAEYFAVFVRRVATRVFSELRLSGWENLSKDDIRMINSFSEIEAIMSLDGNILNVKLLSSSGSSSFDDILKHAVKVVGKDNNPPANAKADDNLIHFIFQAKSWSKMGTNPNGSLGERRWLLLSTGLK